MAYVEEHGLKTVNDAGALEAAARKVLEENADAAEQYRQGKEKILGFLIGQLMRETKGQANPSLAGEILKNSFDSVPSMIIFSSDGNHKEEKEVLTMRGLDYTALTIVIIGAVNWGLIGFFRFDLVAFIFGNMSWISRIVYGLVGICGLYMLSVYGRISDRSANS